MFDIDYEWKLIYLVSFNRMCFLLLAINEVDVLRIWWNYYDCMFDFAFGRRKNVCWKDICWRQQQKEKVEKVAKLVSTTNNKKKKKKRICWCLLWCLLKFWSITGLLQKSMLLKNELKRRNVGCWIGWIGWIDELVDLVVDMLFVWLRNGWNLTTKCCWWVKEWW